MTPRRTLLLLLGLLAACDDDSGPTDPGVGEARWSIVEAGGRHACGLTTEGEAYCWGSNVFGARGDGTLDTAAVSRPARVEADRPFARLSVGEEHACALTADGAAYCWGRNHVGQLGIGTSRDENFAVAVETELRFSVISAGVYHTCALTGAGEAYCWGGGGAAEQGRDLAVGYEPPDTCTGLIAYFSSRCSKLPRKVSGGLTFDGISAGLFHSCGVTREGDAYCWGWNRGQLGNGEDRQQQGDLVPDGYASPQPVLGGRSFRTVSAGVLHSCGVTATGSVDCWGAAVSAFNFGQLGTGSFEGRLSPAAVRTELTFSTVDASAKNSIFNAFTCGVSSSGSAHCWGADRAGQLGTPSAEDVCRIGGQDEPCSSMPLPVTGGLAFATVSTGLEFTCGVTSDGAGYCWGLNSDGQLGDGTTVDTRAPAPIADPAR